MATPDVESDIAALLVSVLGYVQGTNITAGRERSQLAAPVRPFVLVQVFGGRAMDNNDGPMRAFAVQVTYLGARDEYATSETACRAIHDALHRKGRFTVGANTYMDIQGSVGFTYLGVDDDGSERFVEAFEVWHDGSV
jgi:hypothetical protein